ncbi:hypothetical protein [Dialister invisus]
MKKKIESQGTVSMDRLALLFVTETTFHSCVIMGKINPFIG